MIQLFLTRGSETLNFGVVLDGYYPEVPDDDDELEVEEDFYVAIAGGKQNVEEKIGLINRWLRLARELADMEGTYLNFAMDEERTPYRARLLGGSARLDSHATGRWREGKARVTVTIRREVGWEGPEVQIPLTNPNGTENTSGLKVFGFNDGSGTAPNTIVNYIDIDGDDVPGDMPARTRLEITHASAEMMLSRIYIGHNWTDPANAAWTLEAEDAQLFGSPVPTIVDAATASGGKAVRWQTLSSGVMTTHLKWTLPVEMLTAARGQWVHAVAMFRNSDTVIPNCAFQLRMGIGNSIVWKSKAMRPAATGAGAEVRDLFCFRLPPWPVRGKQAAATLSLLVAGPAGSSRTLELDFLNLLPADGWRSYENVLITSGMRLVDDGINGVLNRDSGPVTPSSSGVLAYGAPIELQPGLDHRLYFMMQDTTGFNQDKTQALSVKLFARPRRRLI